MNILKTFSAAFSLILLSVSAHGEALAVGAAAPSVTGMDQDGKLVVFKDVYAKGPTLVYFYPKADTPGCTKQACSLRDDWSALQKQGIQVIGISEDTAEDQKKFKDKYMLQFTLVADSEGKLAQAFGVPFRGKVTARQSFLVKDGKIAWNMLDKTSTATHAQDVLKAYGDLPKS